MATPRLTQRLTALLARVYAGQPFARDAAQFLDEAAAHEWRARRWRGLAALCVLVCRDAVRIRVRGPALPLTTPTRGPRAPRSSRSLFMDRFQADLRHAARTLGRAPGFTAIAVLTLGLGIGATTAVYAVVDGAILRPFPYHDMDSIVLLGEMDRENAQPKSVAWPNFVDWRARNDVMRELGIYRGTTLNVTGADLPERLVGALVSASVFDTMGIPPLRGRAFTAADDEATVGRIVIISERLWRRRFSARDDVLGASIQINNEAYSIVGVMPASMRFPSRTTDMWLPLGQFVTSFPPRGAHPGLTAVGRLRPGVTIDRARAAFEVIAQQLEQEYPDSNKGATITVDSYLELIVRDVRPAMQMLLAAVGLLLLIACANLTGLQLARGEARQRELAIRAALGAGRRRLVRQLLVESTLLGLLGGVAGVALAYGAIAAFTAVPPSTIPRIDLVGIDWRVLAFALFVSILTVVLVGMLPALRASRPALQDALSEGRANSGGVRAVRLRKTLVVAQIAVAVMLLVGAGLLTKSFGRLLAIDLGFETDRAVTMRYALPNAKYPTPDAWMSFHDRLLESLKTVPGVDAVGVNSALPLEGGASESPVIKEGDPPPSPESRPAMCMFQTTAGDYFAAMGIRLVRGRTFDGRDGRGSAPVIVVDESLVARLFPNVDPIGRRIAFEFEGAPPAAPRPIWREIVGVVATVRHYGLLANRPFVQLYVPHTQLAFWSRERRPSMALAVKPAPGHERETLVADVRRAVAAVDATIPLYNVVPMRTYLDIATEAPRLSSTLLTGFAGLALVLAIVGVYGMLSYIVALRTREIGVRIALGARKADILRGVVGQGLVLTGIGLAVGLLLAVAASRLLASQLYQVSPTDAVVYVGAAVVLAVVAAIASAIPARRASSVDPLTALRN